MKYLSLCGALPSAPKKEKKFLIEKDQKDLTNPASYCPIALLESFAKLFEKILVYRLRNHMEGRQINPNQFGFRPERSMEQIIYLTLKFLDLFHIKNRKTASVSFDVSKVFDKVCHNGLIYKLHTMYNLPPLIEKILTHFLYIKKKTVI